MFGRPTSLYPADKTLPGRDTLEWDLPAKHRVLGTPLLADPADGSAPEGYVVAYFGLGCFWGAEEMYWQIPGVYATAVGYQGGTTLNPTYEEVCSGLTNHTEAVRIVFDPTVVSYADLMKRFFEVHDPTQGMRQGNDVGTQYRSALYFLSPEQEQTAHELTKVYGEELARRGLGEITTEIREAPIFYPAEPHHQQYLDRVPNGYRCHANTGVAFPA
ncbi:peptide-methionine (S)-S-oxide reductase MsrA [Nocardioides sp. Iso805N]|uniref:peptide-methionine (S)-S-oxide reductase MsrA n=1 Tax=Nocardioides sp. Iso805N TaxID=1283287 RepID=UPI00037A034A|nr:peptide-methionine (S)-S-oxide reductase MsrA [Nocardioides sp. Iso805N]